MSSEQNFPQSPEKHSLPIVNADEMPITHQPGFRISPDVMPPGLEYLISRDIVIIKKKYSTLERYTGCKTENNYSLVQANDEELFTASEKLEACVGQCCGNCRELNLNILDDNKQVVIRISRLYRCCAGSGWMTNTDFGDNEYSISTQYGPLARMYQLPICLNPTYELAMLEEDIKFRISGPNECHFLLCAKKQFEIEDLKKQHIGNITKEWQGFTEEYIMREKKFHVTFSTNMPVKQKAALLSAAFIISFMHFEKIH